MTGNVRGVSFYATARRELTGNAIVNSVGVEARGRHRFRIRIPYAARALYVVIEAHGRNGGTAKSAPVRIAG